VNASSSVSFQGTDSTSNWRKFRGSGQIATVIWTVAARGGGPASSIISFTLGGVCTSVSMIGINFVLESGGISLPSLMLGILGIVAMIIGAFVVIRGMLGLF